MPNATPPLHDSAFMQAFLDLVIPPGDDGKMPGAGSLGLADGMAARVEADPALGPIIQAGLQAVYDAAVVQNPSGLAALPGADGTEVIESQLAAHPMLMLGVAVHLYPAFYQHPRVLEGLGEPPRAPFPEGFDLEPTDPALLEKLRARADGGGQGQNA